MVTLRVSETGPAMVFYRSAAHVFDSEHEAIEYVARVKVDRPDVEVKVEATA
jgi:hypothetical protein